MSTSNYTWFFGTSSKWSEVFIENLPGDVFKFGRNLSKKQGTYTVNYHPDRLNSQFKEFDKFPIPSLIVFNINTGGVKELHTPYQEENTVENYTTFNKWWKDNSEQLFFKHTLLEYLLGRGFTGKVCYITSQISVDRNPKWNNLLLYKSLRSIDYELIWNMRNKGVNAFGVCPASNRVPERWASFISNFIQKPDIGLNEWLYGVSENSNDNSLTMIKYPTK